MNHNAFRNDYGRFAHPRILKALLEHGEEPNAPYGLDEHSFAASSLLRETFGAKDAEVALFAGGTVTNMVFISHCLKPYEAVIAATTAHIAVHETGAVEASGHKVIVVPGIDGKITVEGIEKAVATHTDEHMVLPRMVYISNATETGTIYTKKELQSIYDCCKKHNLYLYIDGARLGVALTCDDNDLKPEEIGSLCDAFYVGGGKNGLGIGEALLIVNPELKPYLRYHIKNRGAMLAKGYVLGIEFEEGFRDGLYFDLARKANAFAKKVGDILQKSGYSPAPFSTNQVFATFPSALAERLISRFGCERWAVEGDQVTIRFVTSYATEEEDLLFLEKELSLQ